MVTAQWVAGDGPGPVGDGQTALDGTSSLARGRRFVFQVAGPQDDPEIRRLLRESSFPGDICLSLQREPDGLAAGSIEGDVHHLMVARERTTGQVAAVASRSVRDAFVNGEPQRLGCLGQLRIATAFRQHRRLLDGGFEFCRQIHERGDARLYLVSVVAGNDAGRRLLGRRVPGWPRIEVVDRLVTLAIPVRSAPRRPIRGVQLEPGSAGRLHEIVQCLSRNGRRFQFSPCWSAADLLSATRTRALSLRDFVVAVRDDRVVGCLACWDQRTFRQVVVTGYARALRRWRPLLNLIAPWAGIPALPPAGAALDFAYISHVAVDADDEYVLRAMMIEACRRVRASALDYVALGLAAHSPLLPAARRDFAHRTYESVLSVAFWPDGEALARSLDGRPSYPELALL